MNERTLAKMRAGMTHNRFNARLGASRVFTLQTAPNDIDSHISLLREVCVILSELSWP